MSGYSDAFARALAQTIADHEQLSPHDPEITDLFYAPELLAAGVSREDALRLCADMLDEYGPELRAGGPDAHASMLAIIEIALTTGVHLERARQNEATRILDESD